MSWRFALAMAVVMTAAVRAQTPKNNRPNKNAPDDRQVPAWQQVKQAQTNKPDGQANSNGGGQPIVSRDRAFLVPFKVDPIERARLMEVQLFFSTDRGQTWKQYTTARPDEEQFRFAARNDGEHWFAVRTLDRERRLYPPTLVGVGPGLRVIVDTTPPEVTLNASNSASEQIGIEWEVNDVNLDVGTLRAEFRTDDAPTWYPVQIQPLVRGKAAWKSGANGPIVVRLRVLDRAGNEGVKEVQLGQPTGVPAFGSGRRVAGNNPTVVQPPNRDDFQVPSQPNLGPLDPSAAFANRNEPAKSTVPQQNPQGSGRVVPFDRNDSATPLPEPGRANPQVAPKLVNSTRFAINYNIEEKGKSGVASVKLYFTYDGRAWEEYGEDDDKQSPFLVKVNGEGTYGFSIVAKSGAGIGEDAPTAGDTPQVWIEVDITPPSVSVIPPEPGRGVAAGVLSIAWNAQDRNLAPKSISLSYSESASGPWKSIATGIDNTGRFQWQMPPEVPYKFYVRVEAKDRAGNVGRADTDTPVVVDLSRPKAKIMGVAPADGTPTTGAKLPD